MLHKFLTFQVTLLIWASVILHAVHVELDELVLQDDMLGEGGVLDVIVAEHTVFSLELEWLYEGLGHVLDQGVGGDVLVVPAKDVHWGVGIAIDSQQWREFIFVLNDQIFTFRCKILNNICVFFRFL